MSICQLTIPVFIVVLSVWLGVVIIAICLGSRRFSRVYYKNWYDLSSMGPNEEMEWSQIRHLTKHDPLNSRFPSESFRICSCKYFIWDISIASIALAFLATFPIIFVEQFCNPICADSGPPSTEFLVYLAVFAGVPTLVMSIVVLFYQIRLKARSENRQDWINSIRIEIGHLVDLLPPEDASVRSVECLVPDV